MSRNLVDNLPSADLVYEGYVWVEDVETYPCWFDEGYGDWIPESWLSINIIRK